MPPFDRREFLKIIGAGAAATTGLAACSKGESTTAEPAASSAPVATPAPGGMPEGFYDLPMKGKARLLHITDVHGQLKPVYFREPNVNLGVGDAFGRPPHLVGKKLLEANELSANTPESYAYTYLDFENAAHTYGMTGGYAHIKTLLEQLREQAGGKQNTLTLDGGDLLHVGKHIYAGLSTRSNKSGIAQLRNIVAIYDYSVKTVETTKCLHLKSAVSEVAPGLLLINPDWVDRSAFRDFELIDVDVGEPHAANALRVGTSVIYPSSFPRTMEKLAQRGIDVMPVDVSELQKAEGAVTCCSLILSL